MTASDGFIIHWVTKSAAGLRQPGLQGDLATELTAVRRAGIDVLVTLTMTPLPQHQLMLRGLQARHFPIFGMGVPQVEAAITLCEELAQQVRTGSKIAFHCQAGVGRTGMMLACHLVSRGVAPGDAIARVRGTIPRAIQTSGQEAFVQQFAEAFGEERGRSGAR
jgi:atypical dual specificity phosphatase